MLFETQCTTCLPFLLLIRNRVPPYQKCQMYVTWQSLIGYKKNALSDTKPNSKALRKLAMIVSMLPIWMLYPRNCTVVVPTPPERVTTTISPVPLAWPVLAMILLGDFHSVDSKQSTPQIVRPATNTITWQEMWHQAIPGSFTDHTGQWHTTNILWQTFMNSCIFGLSSLRIVCWEIKYEFLLCYWCFSRSLVNGSYSSLSFRRRTRAAGIYFSLSFCTLWLMLLW